MSTETPTTEPNPFADPPGQQKQEPTKAAKAADVVDLSDGDEVNAKDNSKLSQDIEYNEATKAFDFPDEAKFIINIYSYRYEVDPKSLLVCPREWLRQESVSDVMEALESMDGWIEALSKEWSVIKVTLVEFEADAQVTWAPRRIAAEQKIYARRKVEKEAGTRKDLGSQPTILDLENEQAIQYPEAWKKHLVSLRKIKNRLNENETLRETLKSRKFTLSQIIKVWTENNRGL